MVYLFTNHQNLLQAATKGYLSPFAYWRRFRKDFEEIEIEIEKLYECLIFGKHPLPHPYLYETDKSLHAVAIGIEEKILDSIGYSQSGSFYVGTGSVPISLIAEIIFETPSGPSLLNNRYIEYSRLLGKTQFPVQPSLFRQQNVEDQVTPGSDKNAILKERQYDRAFGALGHMLEELKDVQSTDCLLAIYLLQTHHFPKSPPLKVESLISFAKSLYPSWSLEGFDVELLNIISGFAKYGQSLKPTSIKKEYGEIGCTIFTFLHCLDKVLDTVDKTLQSMDRKEFFESIYICYSKNKNAQASILDVLEKILKIYDYDYMAEELLGDISKSKNHSLQHFLFGLEIFSRDPIDTKNISQLKASVKLPQNTLSYAVALFLWGRTHGAFSLDPVKKLEMLSVYGVENFNSLCIPEYSTLPEVAVTIPNWPIDDESTQHYEGSKFWIEKDSGVERNGFVLYTTKINSHNGFTFEYQIEDYFEDVIDFLKKFKSGRKSLSADELIFMLENCIPIFGEFTIGNSKHSLEFDSFDTDSLTLGMRQANRSRKSEIELPVTINLSSLDAWNDLVRLELSPQSLSVKLKQAIRENLITTPPNSEEIVKEVPKSKPTAHTNKPQQPKAQQDGMPMPTENDKNDVIIAYMKEQGIKLPSKKNKAELLKAIEQNKTESPKAIQTSIRGI